ncbi:MAG: hypothetical protein RR420_05460 [Anaerovoracaceae bacterium]
MGETTANAGFSWGWVIFIVLILWFFVGGGLGNNRADAFGCGCNRVSNCEVEKQGIIDSARTQYLIEQQAAGTRELVMATANVTQTKIDYYAYENLRDQLAQERSKNIVLENRVYSDAQFNALQRQNENMFCALKTEIADLSCQVPKRPPYYAQGFITCGNPIPPNGCGC